MSAHGFDNGSHTLSGCAVRAHVHRASTVFHQQPGRQDFGGRNWIEWQAEFKREKIGDMPTEMFYHFFKSFSDASKCNLNIKVEGQNEHHKIESIFKAFAKAIKIAVKRDANNMSLPSTKGML